MAARNPSADNITEQLRAWSGGKDTEASEAVLTLVYDELHRQAQRYLSRERAGHTLQTTALVHEVYLKLVKQENIAWESRSHFFGIAAKLMRQILIDYARTKHRAKRGGAKDKAPLESALTVGISDTNFDLLALDEALTRLAAKEEHLAKIVELRFFSGLSVEETAEVLGISESTIKRDWQMAKTWLHRELTR
ncbi:MAG: sigma-70 family RNA polymerase sigma factor [Acidobacteriota bacterium]|nr:sigma-70 family RNA polymerase sigma factor [Acidobacteriota bacterium]